MAREIKVITWCDPCLDQDRRTEGTEFTFTVGVGRPKVISVCGEHDKVVTEFVELFERYAATNPDAPRRHKAPGGTAGGANPEKVDPRDCPFCEILGMPVKRLKNAQAQSMHQNRTHGITASQYAEYEAGKLVIVSHQDGRVVLGPAEPASSGRAAS